MSALEPTLRIPPTHETVLQLATDRQVHAFDLSEKFRIGIGRHESNDIQLRSGRVSSYHAEILSEVDGLFVRDLGSTNGTYVNDESVRRQQLRSGDRIRIGRFTISVRLAHREINEGEDDGKGKSFPVGAIGNVLPFRGRPPRDAKGGPEPSHATLPDLLSQLARAGASVLVSIKTQTEEGKVFVLEGGVTHCELGAARKEKALYRLMALSAGKYEIRELPPAAAVPRTITTPTESLVVEGMQQVEALEGLAAKLPAMMFELALEERCAVPVSTLTPDEIEIYQSIIRYKTLHRVLEESPMTDFMVMLFTHSLLQNGFFRVTGNAGALLEETIAEQRVS